MRAAAGSAALAAVALLAALAIPSLAIASQFIHYTRSNLLTHDERYGNLIRAPPADAGVRHLAGRRLPGRPDPLHAHPHPDRRCRRSPRSRQPSTRSRQGRIRLPLVAATVAIAALFLDRRQLPVARRARRSRPRARSWSRWRCSPVRPPRPARPPDPRRDPDRASLSAAVLYSDVSATAPRGSRREAQLAELQKIGQLFAGQGPALMTEYQPYGVRHFLRKLDARGRVGAPRRARCRSPTARSSRPATTPTSTGSATRTSSPTGRSC